LVEPAARFIESSALTGLSTIGTAPAAGRWLIAILAKEQVMTTAALTKDDPGTPHIRTAHDATDDKKLARNPSDEDAKLDVALDETFPTSDAPSNTQPGKGKDPAPSSGYDEQAERRRQTKP